MSATTVTVEGFGSAIDLHDLITRYVPTISNRIVGSPAAFFIPKGTAPTLSPLGMGGDKVSEVVVINRAIEALKTQVRNFAPSLADLIEVQKPLVYATAMAFKNSIQIQNKSYALNPTAGSLGVSPLFPAAIKPSSTTKSDYILNTWDIALTAGTTAYLLGGATDFYKGSTTADATTWYYIFANGLVETGSTPSIEQIKIISQEKQAISPYTTGPFVDVPVNKDYPAYIYPLPAFYIDNQSQGIKLAVLPRRTGTVTLKLIGLVFYEYNFFSDFKTAT